ncbi:hypothetical protein BGZ95_004176 [Linnemannia exigua]|uniref:Uncharacterized protein n=1 Tax=Linnemannia exigua TaxID=604196 RepID=A0AAD4D3T1_9FUNG|nr:hypothetical protein BGZ95_004176 [Linnemannia exigua]
MNSRPVHRSETQKESEDRQYLDDLTRTPLPRAARLKQIAPAPLLIPDSSDHYQQQLLQQQQQQQHLMVNMEQHHYHQEDQVLNPSDFRKRDHEAVHGHSLLAPSRSTTPVPPIPKRPDSRSALYDSGHETMVVDDVEDMLHNVNNNLTVMGLQQQRQQQGYVSGDDEIAQKQQQKQQQQRQRPVSYHPGGSTTTTVPGGNGLGQKQGLGHGHDRYSSYDYGVPINYRTGASEYFDDDDVHPSSGVKVEVRVNNTPLPSSFELPGRPRSTLPHSRLSKQEQHLKRSSQVIPVHHKYNHKNSSTTLVEPHEASTPPPPKEMSKEEREKLEKVFKKKRSLLEKYGPGGPPTVVTTRLDGPPSAYNSQGYLYGDDGSDGGSITKKGNGRWIDRPCGCFPPGLMTFLAFKISLLYNGALSAILFQASQFNDVGMTPIFGFTITFFAATGISVLGLITVAILASRNYHSGGSVPSRVPLRIFKVVHALYLLLSVFGTTGCMLGWLALNKSQTGTWDRVQLYPSPTPGSTTSPSIISHTSELGIEAILKPDPDHPGWLVVNPWLWIFAFVALGMLQLYFWFSMVAYARSHLAQWRSGFQTRMRRLEALRELEDGGVRI